ncbi:hypothetical protein ACHHYP_09796 [Achlya hypogyna]|uniref:Uncharacterized protein n=1 Tax=Achlya hypogyna TaxID=1202772 RepID=A0A1V9YMH4_ACHHY|nr:hypothetical protein ACHHYP_09796 [Achlya hypogyna]
MLSTISHLHATWSEPTGYTDETITRVKSKRLKELHQLKRYIHHLETTVARIKRQRTTVLPWEEVSKALAEDTLEHVRCNRTLRQEWEYYRRVSHFLKDWVDGMVPPRVTPGLTEETWRHATIFAGDAATRRIGYEWLAQQVYFNTDRAMMRFPFATTEDGLVVDVNYDDDAGTVTLEVLQQTILPFAYDDVVAVCAKANKDFVRCIQQRTDCVEPLTEVTDDIEYVQEEMGKRDRQRIFGNVLYGTFKQDTNRTVLVKRTIVKDEAYPLESSVWTLDSKGWLVVEALDDGRTRLRKLDTVGHPRSPRGYVPISDLAAMMQLSAQNEPATVSLMRERFVSGQQHQARLFTELVKGMTTATASHPLVMDLEAILSKFRRKRGKQIAFLRRYLGVLEKRVAHLQWCHSTLMTWEDISKALAEDTLEKVRENRSLKRHIVTSKELQCLLTAWVERSASPFTSIPGPESWTAARLFAGNRMARQVGYEWILQQSFHSTDQALALVTSALGDNDGVSVQMTWDDGVMSLSVASSWTVPSSFDAVTNAAWVASRSFLADCCSSLDDCSTLRDSVGSHIEYFHEDVGPSSQKIVSNALYGRYDTPRRTVLIMRSVLTDEAHPVPRTTWSADSRQWIVIEPVHDELTRVRVYDYNGHPCIQCGTLVPMQALAQLKNLPADSDDAATTKRSPFENILSLASGHECPDNFVLWSSLQTIKSKRVKELAYLKKMIYELESELERTKRTQTTVLPWEEVAKALADDTLEKVRDNRSLKKNVEYNRIKYAFLREWVLTLTPPKRNAISVFHDSWRHSYIFNGDDVTRKIGYEWLIKQVYHNTGREMANAEPFGDDDVDFVHADVTCNDNVMEVRVTSQLLLPISLEDAAKALWVADRTLIAYVSYGTSPYEELSKVTDNIIYHQEDIGPATGRIRVFGNTLYGRFEEDDRIVLVKRSILKDEAYPLDSDVWTCDLKQWIVADRIGDNVTRCRIYDTASHPCTERGYVPIRELAKCYRLEPRDDAEAASLLRLRTIDSQQRERVLFAQHLNNILQMQSQQQLDEAIESLHDSDGFGVVPQFKSKRLREIEYLKKHIYDLQARLSKTKRVRSTLLPWEEVARALADDTLDKVRDNRSLKRELAHNKRLARLLQDWIRSTTPETRQPNIHLESWRHSHIFAGDEATRRVGYEWLIKQLYHNTDRALFPLAFPDDNSYFLDTTISFDGPIISLQQQMQVVLPYSLEVVSRAVWIAAQTFIFYIQRKPHSLSKLLTVNQDIEYVQEDMGPKCQRIDSKLLYGRFHEPNRTAIVTRAVRTDDAFPIEPDTWTTDMKQWFVLDRLGQKQTRCRFYDYLGHPSTAAGYVPLQELVRMYRYNPVDDADAMAYCRSRFPHHQQRERAMFAVHLQRVLDKITGRLSAGHAHRKQSVHIGITPGRRTMVSEIRKIRSITRDAALKPCFENPPPMPHVKCKRLRELYLLSRHIYELEGKLRRLQGRRTTLLPWKDVSRALAEDTLRNVRDNRSLKVDLDSNRRLCAYLRTWLNGLAPIPRSPRSTGDGWQHSQLIAGDPAARRTAYEWIARQAYYNTDAAMAQLTFPIDGPDDVVAVDVNWIDGLLHVNVMTQRILPYSLAAVSASLWVADKTFVQFAQKRSDFRQELQVVSDDMEYVQEEMGPGTKRIFDNVLYGRFYEPNRTVIVMRSILKDEAFPIDEHMWTIDTKQWMVADRISETLTRCRTFYSIKHPSTDAGYVPLRELAECFCHAPASDAEAKRMMRDRFLLVQRVEREKFAAHLDNVPLSPPALLLLPTTIKEEALGSATGSVRAASPLTTRRPDRPLKVSTSTTVKCKRVQELQYLHRHIEELEETLHRCQRPYTPMMLPWKEVSAGLAHDTLVHIRENRCLKKEVESKKRMIAYLKAWMQSNDVTRRSPSPFVESWRNTQLLAGDEAFRKQAYAWIMQQCYHNTDRALSTISFPTPTPDNNFIDVQVVPDDQNLLEIHVTSQRLLPYALPLASEGAWLADKTFYDFNRSETSYREELDLVSPDLEYVKEVIGPQQKLIVDNALYSRFQEQDRVVMVVRSILNDEAHPLDANTWTVDVKQWMVLDAVDAETTRCRTYYIMKHPTTPGGGNVSLEEFAACFELHAPGDDDLTLMRKLGARFEEKQRIERQKFATHMDSVLQRLETLEMLDALKGEDDAM